MHQYEVTVGKDRLGFAAAHFITYGGGPCEALHGHNYRVRATVRGRPDRHGMVVDFLQLLERMQELLEPLDHRTLIPESNPDLELTRGEDSVTVRHGEREYRFPASDVAVVPVTNTTAELMAEHLATSLAEGLSGADGSPLLEVELEVEESPGMASVYTLRRDR